MKKNYKLLLFSIFIAVAPAGQTWPMKCNTVTLNYEFCSVKAVVDKENKLATLNIEAAEKLLWAVPIAEISDIENPILDEVRLLFTSGKSYKSLQEIPDHEWLVIAIKIGKTKEIGSDQYKDKNGFRIVYRVNDVVYFIFNNKGYWHRSRRVVNEKDDVWELYYKDVGEKEIYDGTQEYSPISETAPPSLPSKLK
jgi:hypothetical protein